MTYISIVNNPIFGYELKGIRANAEATSPRAKLDKAYEYIASSTSAESNILLRSATDGITFIQASNNALNTTTDILMRLRSIAVQGLSANINSNTPLNIIQESSRLKGDINRIAKFSGFNNKKLFDGSLNNISFEVSRSKRISVKTLNTFADALGTRPGEVQTIGQRIQLGSSDKGTQGVQEGGASYESIRGLVILPKDVLLTDDYDIAKETYGGIIKNIRSTDILINRDHDDYGFGIAKSVAERVKQIREQEGVEVFKSVYASAVTNFKASELVSLDYSGTVDTSEKTNIALGSLKKRDLHINGVDIGAVSFLKNDSGGSLQNAINSKKEITGVEALVDGKGELELRASDGRDIIVTSKSADVNNLLFANNGARFDKGFENLRITGRLVISSDKEVGFFGNDVQRLGLNDFTKKDTQLNVFSEGSLDKADFRTSTSIRSAIDIIDAAIDQIVSYRDELSAAQNEFLSYIKNNDGAIGSKTSAGVISKLISNLVHEKTNSALLAQGNTSSEQVLSLLV